MPPFVDLLPFVLALLAGGAVAGILAGMFGIGGGAILVPIFFHVFGLLGVPEDVRMQLALGTSLAIIVPTSIRSSPPRARCVRRRPTWCWNRRGFPAWMVSSPRG